MPLKLNISISRKVGEPNYGSRGATVGVEVEVDSSLVNQPQQLHERIARLFRLAKESVERELNAPATSANSNGSAMGQPRPATPAQIRAIHAIANHQNLDLVEELRNRFGMYRADELTLDQASQLIDAMKTPANGAATQQ